MFKILLNVYLIFKSYYAYYTMFIDISVKI